LVIRSFGDYVSYNKFPWDYRFKISSMKKSIFVILIFAFSAAGCEKQEIYNDLVGKWLITSVSGGITGWSEIRDFDGIMFTQKGKYSVLFSGEVIQGGTYRLEKQKYKNPSSGKYDFQLMLDEDFNNHPNANFYSDMPFSFEFMKDESLMTLRQINCSDGFQYDFKRVDVLF
jgi:hypothetical protein